MRKFLSAFLLLSITISSFVGLTPAMAVDEKIEIAENQAYALLLESPEFTRFKTVEMGEETDVRIVEKGGYEVWNVDVTNGTYSYKMCFDLDDNFANQVSDGSLFEIEVEYWNEEQGYLQLVYDSLEVVELRQEFLVTDNTKIWGKKTFIVEDAYFGNRIDGKYDFYLSAKVPYSGRNPTSPASVAVKSVKVTKHTAKNPVRYKGWIDETGNAFESYKEEKIIHNEFTNRSDKAVNTKVTYSAVDVNGVKRWSAEETVALEPGEVKQTEQNIDLDYCQVYNLIVDITDEANGINQHHNVYRFAIIKTDPDGMQNDKFYWNAHPSRAPEHADELFSMIRKSNAYGLRWQMGWYETEPSDGQYLIPDNFQQQIDLMAKYGVHAMWMMYACPKFHTGGWNWIPRGETALAAWERYLRWIIPTIKESSNEMINRFEFWNEPNIRLFNGGGGVATSIDVEVSPEEYVPAAKVAYNTFKELWPEVEFGVLSICDVTSANSFAWLTRSMDVGLGDYCDAITLHPYGVADEAEMANAVRKYKDYVDVKYNKDVDVWNTEVGFSTVDANVGNEETHKDFNVRALLYYLGEDVGDALVIYNLDRGGDVPFDREDYFGAASGGRQFTVEYTGKAFIPRPAYVALTAANYLTAMAEPDKKGDYDEHEDSYIYRLKSEKFNADILTLWSDRGIHQRTLNLGDTEITISDEYGNMTTLTSEDGVYSFHLTETPFYLIGDFDDITISDIHKVMYPETEVVAAKNDMITLEVTVSDELADAKLEVTAPVGARLVEEPVFSGNTAEVKLMLDNSVTEDFVTRLEVKKDGKVVSMADVDIVMRDNKVDAIINASLSSMINMNKWKASAEITNYSETEVATGKLKITYPEMFAGMQPVDIGRIPRGKTSEVIFSLPDIAEKGIYNVQYQVELDNGEVFESRKRLDFAVSKYTSGNIKIDGVIEESEWDTGSWMYAKGIENIRFQEGFTRYMYGGEADNSGRATTAWDEKNFYFAAEIKDDVHYNNYDHSVGYMGDNIQFALYHDVNAYLAAGQAGTKFHEFGIARNEEDAGLYKWRTQTDDTEIGYVKGEGVECEVRHKNGVTYYEAKIPWDVIMGYKFTPKSGEYIGFTYVTNDNDGAGRAWSVAFGGGIVGGKNSALFAKLQFVKPE